MTGRHPKRPRTPPVRLHASDGDLTSFTGVLWRVYRTRGPHTLGWDRMRTWGPASDCRWDPHPEPAGDHPGIGVMYTAGDLGTAVLEAFQATRNIDTITGDPRATSWAPTRPLRLLNLTDDWLLAGGASAALPSGPRTTCRAWARRIHALIPAIDGLLTASTLTGRPNITLWENAEDTFPELPGFSEPLSDDLLWTTLDAIASRYRAAGYRML